MKSLFCPSIEPLNEKNCSQAISLLTSESKDYIKDYHPFPLSINDLRSLILCANHDKYIGLFAADANGRKDLIGIITLRGLDEGYTIPMFGIFIRENWSNQGLCSLALKFAETFCKINKIKAIKLKVNTRNCRAMAIYKRKGFHEISKVNNDTVVMCKKVKI